MILILKNRELQADFLFKQSKGSIKNIKFYDHHSYRVLLTLIFQPKKD